MKTSLHKYPLFFCLVIFLSSSIDISAQVSVGNTTLTEREVIGNLNIPWEIKWGYDGFIWMTERPGIVSRVNVESGEKIVILDIQNTVYSGNNEAGLLGMEFHPDFSNTHILFITYTYTLVNQIKERLSSYTYNTSSGMLENEQILLDNINGYTTHIGSRILALDDYTILISTGDAQDQPASQDINELTGKILRMDISEDNFGGIPIDNPIPNSYVWSWGHRNAQGLELAPNGIIYSSEHGPTNDDELNILVPNRNYGWPNVSYGKSYGTRYRKEFLVDFKTKYNTHFGFEQPSFSWMPSIGISQLGVIKSNGKFSQYWNNNDLIISSLKDKSLYRTRIKNQNVAYSERIHIGERIRSLVVSEDIIFISADNGSLITIRPSENPLTEGSFP